MSISWHSRRFGYISAASFAFSLMSPVIILERNCTGNVDKVSSGMWQFSLKTQ
jgi:hypothetical protein